ncbi:MAG TPA: hypothetical protein VIO57_03650 [Chloroflexota bacterium]|jgi:hypothetical protein
MVPRVLVSAGIYFIALLSICVPWGSAHAAVHRNGSSWSQRDCAAYVVSTMNLMHFRNGRPLTSALVQKFAVTHYDVYADQQAADLYFIEPMAADDSSIGALAYHMGWQIPMSVSSSLDKLHVRHAPGSVYAAYRSDAKLLIGSFTSTFPS